MTMLPTALQPWHSWLGWFDSEIAAVLGEWLLRLDPLLGHGTARAQHGASDHDGVDDLRRRGSYERLLLSEWAMADAWPEEFLRRAAHNEHLFLAPKLMMRQSDALIVAVFDAGPAQWGPARLVHVALWILLARRAQASGARFLWGLAHEPGPLHDADSPAMLKRLLCARNSIVCDAGHWKAWQDCFTTNGTQASERWLLAATDHGAPTFSHSVLTRRGLDEHLHISIGARQNRRQVRLPIPAPRHAKQLLRGNFLISPNDTTQHRVRDKLSMQQPPLFNFTGKYVALALLGEKRAMVLKIQQPGEKQMPPRYHQWASHTELLCGVLSDKKFTGIVASKQNLYFWKIPGFRTVPRTANNEFTITPGLAHWLPCVWLNNGGNPHRLALLDHAGNLLCWSNAETAPGHQETAHELVDGNVLALAQADAQRLIYAQYQPGHVWIKLMARQGPATALTCLPVAFKPSLVLLRGHFQARAWAGTVCLEHRKSSHGSAGQTCVFTLFQGNSHGGFKEYELNTPAQSRPIGLVSDPQSPQDSLLLVLHANRRALLAIGRNAQENIYQASSAIVSASVSADGDRVALVTLDGQLVVLGDGGRSPLMCVNSQAETSNE